MPVFRLTAAFVALGLVQAASAGTVSYNGTLENSTAVFQTGLTLAVDSTVTFQTWGFGGGTNANSDPIPAGGFDALVAVFAGSDASAVYVDAASDNLVGYDTRTGCPPAGTVTVGSSTGVCGDVKWQIALPAGSYTVTVSDALNYPYAAFSGGTLGDGFWDWTGGVFQTCVAGTTDCQNGSGDWALDITDTPAAAPGVPEPATAGLAGFALLALAATRFRTRC